jgi:hypothetical protein
MFLNFVTEKWRLCHVLPPPGGLRASSRYNRCMGFITAGQTQRKASTYADCPVLTVPAVLNSRPCPGICFILDVLEWIATTHVCVLVCVGEFCVFLVPITELALLWLLVVLCAGWLSQEERFRRTKCQGHKLLDSAKSCLSRNPFSVCRVLYQEVYDLIALRICLAVVRTTKSK